MAALNRSAGRGGQILSAAYDIFGAKGFYAAKMDDIAEAAGVAKGTLYLYYANKEELFHAVVEKMLSEYYAGYKARLHEAIPFQEKLVSLARYYMTFLRDRADFAKISMKEAPLTDALRATFTATAKKARAQFVRVIKEAYAEEIGEREAHLAYLSFANMGDGMTADLFWNNRELTDEMIEERAQFIAHLFVNGLGRPKD